MFNGDKIRLSLFGESHGPAIGIAIEGLPPGVPIDLPRIDAYLDRRRSVNALSTPRREPDQVEILSGVTDGFTNGGTLTGMIRNQDTRSRDYDRGLARPSHTDYTGYYRYHGYADYRGGGFFSGRLTAPLVFAGGIIQAILQEQGVCAGTHVLKLHQVCDRKFTLTGEAKETLLGLGQMPIPVLNQDVAAQMEQAILQAKKAGDSVGGILECMVLGVPPFIGGAYFDRLQAKIARLVFSIPGFLGLEFGLGFAAAEGLGSQINDSYALAHGQIKTRTNHSGGINGGITNGMPIVLRTAVRPTPSISLPQQTVDFVNKEEKELVIHGRHDPCIAVRAAVVLESMVLLAVYDTIHEEEEQWKN